MRIARDDQGNRFGEIDGNWVPITVAKDRDGKRWFHTGDEKWTLVDPQTKKSDDTTDTKPQDSASYVKNTDLFSGYNAATDALSMDSTSLDTSGADARSMGLAGRGVLNGIASIPQLAGMGVDLATGAVGFDTHLGDINLGDKLADTIGMPKPENDRERLLSSAISGGASMLTPFGAGKVLASIGSSPKIARFLTAAPKMQVASGAAAGATDEAMRQNDFGPMSRFAGSMAAGIAPGALVGSVRSGITAGKRLATDFRSPSGQMDIAASILEDNGITPKSIDSKQAAYQGKFRGLSDPELDPTLGMLYADDATINGLGASLEQGGGEGAKITGRHNAIRNASQKSVNREMEAAQGKIDAVREGNSGVEARYITEDVPVGKSAEDVGKPMMEDYDVKHGAARRETSEAYDKAYRDNDTPYDPHSLLDAIDKEIPHLETKGNPEPVIEAQRRLGYFARPYSRDHLTGGLVNGSPTSRPVPWQELQSIRGDLSDAAYSLSKEKPGQSRITTSALKALDDATDSMEKASTRSDVHAARNARVRQTENFELGANEPLAHNVGRGQNRRAIEYAEVPGNYFKQGVGGDASMESFLKWGNPEDGMNDYVRSLIYENMVSPEGGLNRSGIFNFQRAYRPALKRLGTMDEEIANHGKNMKNFNALDESQSALEESLSQAGTKSKRTGDWTVNDIDVDEFGPSGKGLFSKSGADSLNDALHPLNVLKKAQSSAKMPGSPTSRNLAGQHVLDHILPGANVPTERPGFFKNAAGTVKNALNNKIVQMAVGATEEANTAVKTHLQLAYADPSYAKYLLEQAAKHPKDPVLKGVKDGLLGGTKGGILGAIDGNDTRDKKKSK